MAESHKRPHEFIDLSQDSPPRPSKVSRTLQSSSQLQAPAYSAYTATQVARDEEEEEDGNTLIDLTQTEDNVRADFVPVGMIENKVVGIRYYNGYATRGESVVIAREPNNQYDRNAIKVSNVTGRQVGHLSRQVAEKLAPFLDSGELAVEGFLTGEKGQFDAPIRIILYGVGEAAAKAALQARMRERRVPLSTRKRMNEELGLRQPVEVPVLTGRKPMGLASSQSSSNPKSSQPSSSQTLPPPPDLNHLIAQSHQVSRNIEELAEQWGEPETVLKGMPMAQQPEEIEATLLPYQLQGLQWMKEKENPQLSPVGSQKAVQLWKRDPRRKDLFINVATNYTTLTTPTLFRGGILADDMGLGKTLQIISLIATGGGTGPTLILAPLSVLSNWSRQIERHVKKTCPLNVYTYHGPSKLSNGKPMKTKDFEEYHVVITTYGTVSSEYMSYKDKVAKSIPRSTGLFSLKWNRVVLDEGHQIRNPNSKMAGAASNLLANSRWVLSGTPIVNSIKDLYSMLRFLGISGGLELLTVFNQILSRPLASGDPKAESLLQTIMRTMCLRRKKDMQFVDIKLPPLSEFVYKVKFRNDEKEKYDSLLAEAQGLLKQHQDQGASSSKDKNASYRHILEILLRLRQVCNHWQLCGKRVTDILAALNGKNVLEMTPENVSALQSLLQLSIESQEECAICLDNLHNPVITACKHVFGYDCIEKTIGLQHKCPMCRAELKGVEELIRPAKEIEDADIDINTKSSKTEALLQILRAVHENPESKVVIFSQWTSFLNIIQAQLAEANYKFTRIDGTMPAKQRDAAMTALEKNTETTIMLASLSVASVGLNLVAADTIILCDCWWAPAVEDQAVDRVHRLGQTRPTTVWRLVMEDSIEERVVEIQKEKRMLVSKAFQEKGGKTGGKTRGLADIQRLLR